MSEEYTATELPEIVVKEQPAGIPDLLDDRIIAAADKFEKIMEAYKRIWRLALKATNESDWCDQGGTPYLEEPGAIKIARDLGISWTKPVVHKTPTTEGHYNIMLEGDFTFLNRSIHVMGGRSSNDEFFTVKKSEWVTREDGTREKKKLIIPASEIDHVDVMKSAFSNWIARGVKELLGLKKVSWEDLQVAGLNIATIKKIDYKKPSAPPPSGAPQPPAEQKGPKDPTKPISENQLKAIYAMLGKMGVNEKDRLNYVGFILSREVKELTTLTMGDASAIIDHLNTALQDTAGATK